MFLSERNHCIALFQAKGNAWPAIYINFIYLAKNETPKNNYFLTDLLQSPFFEASRAESCRNDRYLRSRQINCSNESGKN